VSEVSNLLKYYTLAGVQEGECFSSPRLPRRRHSGSCHLFVRFQLFLTL
jgi:hypothetical protein